MVTPSRGLLDTCVIIAFEQVDAADLPNVALVSTVTLAELSVGPLVARDPYERAIRQQRLQTTEKNFDPLPFDIDCARAFGQVSSDLRAAGRTSHARTYDAMIAATALANGLPLLTLNPGDFAHIRGLDVHPLTITEPKE